jgi:hypothetical protein
MGETRVDLLHLLEDLRDAYPGALEETILTEIIANSLDSGARVIRLMTDPPARTITVLDDGTGMQRRELARYHDIAASTKTRGEGIGFAGVGIKLGLLICEEVLTETRRGSTHIATRWHLASRNKAPWKWTPPPGIVPERGTAVSLRVSNALSPLLDPGFIEGTLRRHYQALLEPMFEPLLREHYPHGARFEVNGRVIEPEVRVASLPGSDGLAQIEVRLARKRKPSAMGYLVRETLPLPEDRRGLAISTLGKIIKRGWDWIGLSPATPELVGGLIEAPALAGCLTLNKADFIRSGPRGATCLAYRKAIQEVVSRQLASWGDARGEAEEARRRVTRPVERDLERVLVDLADDFPLLASLVERREGGQRRLPIGRGEHDARGLVATALSGIREAAQAGEPQSPPAAGAVAEGPPPPEAPLETPPGGSATLPGLGGPRRPARYGLAIQFESRPDEPELGRLVESTVWVNEAHPAYRRAAASRSEGYHLALAVAMALAPLAVEPAQERAFVNLFLESWGGALEEGGKTGRPRPARRRPWKPKTRTRGSGRPRT